MAVINLNNLVLRGAALGNARTVWSRIGGYQVNGLAVADLATRHPSTGCPAAMPDRHPDLAMSDAGRAARAGRSERRAGVPVRRSPASCAGTPVLSRTGFTTGGPLPTAVKRLCRLAGKRLTVGGEVGPGRPDAFAPSAAFQRECRQQVAQAGRAGLIPAGGTQAASTRGKGF